MTNIIYNNSGILLTPTFFKKYFIYWHRLSQFVSQKIAEEQKETWPISITMHQISYATLVSILLFNLVPSRNAAGLPQESGVLDGYGHLQTSAETFGSQNPHGPKSMLFMTIKCYSVFVFCFFVCFYFIFLFFESLVCIKIIYHSLVRSVAGWGEGRGGRVWWGGGSDDG